MKRVIIATLETLLVLGVIALIGFGGWIAYINLRIESIETRARPDYATNIVNINGYELHVRTYGDMNLPPLVLLHDFNAIGGINLTELARGMSTNHYVIVPDLLGFGFSQRLAESGDHYTYAGQARLLATLLDQMGIGTIDLAGHGYGGAVAGQFALDYPNRVRRIAFISAAIYPPRYNLGLRALPLGIGRALTYQFEAGGTADYSHEANNCFNCEEVLQNPYVLMAGTSDALHAIHRSTDNQQLAQRITSLTLPVLVVWGADDQVTPLEDGERLIQETNASETVIIPNGGHAPHEVNLGEVLETLQYFFEL